jgi:hypothetical protein
MDIKKYVLVLQGWDISASGYSLTKDEVEKLYTYMSENDMDDISQLGDDIFDIIDHYPFDGNMWNLSKPLDESLSFMLYDANDMDNPILEFDADDMTDHYDVDPTYEVDDVNGYPAKGQEENILIQIEQNKGRLGECVFESEEIPTAKDFSLGYNCIYQPDGDLNFINNIYYKGNKLDYNLENADIITKGVKLHLWTLKDVE